MTEGKMIFDRDGCALVFYDCKKCGKPTNADYDSTRYAEQLCGNCWFDKKTFANDEMRKT